MFQCPTGSRRLALALSFISLLFATGCALKTRKPLTPAARSQLRASRIIVAYPRSAPEEYALARALGGDLARELAPLGWFGDDPVEVHTVDDAATMKWIAWTVRTDSTAPVLIARLEFGSNVFSGLMLTAAVSIFSGEWRWREGENGQKVKSSDLQYWNLLSTGRPISTRPVISQPDALPFEDDAATRQALQDALVELARMIAFDLQQESDQYSPQGDAERVSLDAQVFTNGTRSLLWYVPSPSPRPSILEADPPVTVEGYTVRREAGRRWVRLPSGELRSVGPR
jgi:hypothetical protein